MIKYLNKKIFRLNNSILLNIIKYIDIPNKNNKNLINSKYYYFTLF